MSDFYLQEELMMNVLLRLSIKSTVRFRCVSKSWCASLFDPQFIYKNLTLPDAENRNENDLLLVLDREREYYSVVSHEPLLAAPLQLSPLRNVPVADEHLAEVLTYCCDDLVCFHNESREGLGVWNLTTGETKILPSLDNFRFNAIGFGYDDKIQDYKIVQIGFYNGVYEVYVYSLRTGNNCWRKLDQPNVPIVCIGNPYRTYCRSYRDGVFYWCDSDNVILSFDMRSEVFDTISILEPSDLLDGFYGWERIHKLKDESMLLISCTGDGRVHDLWALLDCGVSSSLTKLLSIDGHPHRLLPLGFWRNEFVCELGWERLIVGDPYEEPKEVEIDKPITIVSCLVWTKGKNPVALN